MKQSIRKNIILFLIFVSLTMTIFLMAINVSDKYQTQAYTLIFCHFFMCICGLIIASRPKCYFFEPIIFVFAMYYMIFVFTPLLDINNGNVEIFGTNTMSGCFKATLIFMISFVSLLMGYYFKVNIFNSNISILNRTKCRLYNKKSLLKYSYLIWGVTVGAYLLYNMLNGRNILYMLSFGYLSRGLKEVANFDVDFLSMVIYFSFYPLMNIIIYSKSKTMKIICYFVTCVPIATRGFRSVFIIPMLAPFIYNYVKRKKSPSLRTLSIVLLLVFLMMGVLEQTRSSMRMGDGLNLENYTYSEGAEGALEYFSSYKAFYGAVQKYPSTYNYTMGRQLSYAITMYVPRIIWPAKPNALIQEVIGNSTNEIARMAGAAWPNIGEYYTDVGVLGTVFVMFLLGTLLRNMKYLYFSNDQSHVILYSILLPGLLPIIAYGYTAGNLPAIVFMCLPLVLQRLFVKTVRV